MHGVPSKSRTAARSGARRRLATLLASAATVLSVLTLLSASAAAQWRPVRTVPAPIDFATSQNDNLFSLVRSQDDIHALETAIRELAEGKHDAAVRRLHELLRIDPIGVVPVAPGRYLGTRNAVIAVLANMSPAAVDLYEEFAAREAGNLMARPLHELSPSRLDQLADRFPTTRKGLAARLLLGDRALERGDGLAASDHYRAALDATAIGSNDEERVIERLEVAHVLVDPVSARADAETRSLHQAAGDVLPTIPAPAPRQTAIGGGRSGRTPMDEPVGDPSSFWREEVVAPGFTQREKGELAMFPTGDLDTMFVANGRELIALDPLSQSIRWVSVSPLRDFGMDDYDRDEDRERRRGRRRGRGRSRWSNAGDTINQDMVLSAAVTDDVVVAALQVPDTGANVDFQGSFRIMSKIPQRRLFAFSRQTGKVLWRHFDEIDGPRTRRYRGHDSCGPPIIAGDTVYAPIHDRSGAIAFSVAAYDLRDGTLKWRRLVCSSQQDVNMFGNARMEYASSPLALHHGVLYGATNLGVAFAVDALSGRVRWITSYDVVRMPKAMLHNQADRQVYFANNSPVVADGIVCMTPLDSQYALGLDADGGNVVWRLPFDARIGGIENRVQWLCGALDDEFVLSGAGVVAVKARPESVFDRRPVFRQLVRPDQIGDRRRIRMPARPAVTADHVYVPTVDRVLAFDRAGNPHQSRPRIELNGYQPGNLMLVDGAIASLRSRAFELALDPAALLQRSEARVRANPDDPNALLQLATLRRSLQGSNATVAEAAAVQELYRRGLQACIDRGLPAGHPTRQALQRELFDQALKVAQSAADAGAADTLERLAIARDLAPDDEHWIEVHTQVLSRCRSDRDRFLRELQRLEQRAPAGVMPSPLRMRVAAFVLWQRAIAYEDEPKQAVLLWQRLLETYGTEPVGGETAGAIAEHSLSRLIEEHGRAVYAAIDERAVEALQAAGNDPGSLEAVTRRFPNSLASERAGMRLLDRAVEEGDLGVACAVLARAVRTEQLAPGILRRVQVAAINRGNRPLAASMADLLDAHPDAPSDWQDDAGKSFAQAGRDALTAMTAMPAPPATQVPAREVAKIKPRTRQEYVRMLPTRTGRGFTRPEDAPIYVVAGSDLVAFDLQAGRSVELFSESVEFLEHCIVCGTTLVVPDMERLFAVDYRSGELRWELEFEQPRLIESLGITNGVLHISAQPAIPDGNSELIGVEPLTGTRLFQRSLDDRRLKPKPTSDQLLLMAVQDGAAFVERIDPITGRALSRIDCKQALGPDRLQLRPDSLATRLYPQGISGDARHLYLPVDGRSQENTRPQLFALTDDGEVSWRWQGTEGTHLLMAQRRGERFVVAEASDQRSCRMVLLDANSGQELRAVDIGHDAAILNWERSWLDNPAPPIVAVGSEIDRQEHQRQLICFAVEDGPSFAVPLRPSDGDVERMPLFGDGFVTFGVRARSAGQPFRIYAIDLESRRGAFAGNTKDRAVPSPGSPHGMTGVGPYTVLSTTQGLILLGEAPDQNR
jgi:outer membrane protein assembly factor BamB